MRIVHIGKFYPPEWGGIESVTEALAVGHAAQGHQVTVVCFSRKRTETSAGNPRVVRVKAFAEVVSQPLSLKYLYLAFKYSWKADILHVHAPNLLACVVAILSHPGTKIVIHWHADIEGKGLLGKLIRPIERMMLWRADAVVGTSESYSTASPVLDNCRQKVTTIPLGIGDNRSSVTDASADGYVLFVGRLVPYKGLRVLLRAISLVSSDIHFIIVGEGPESEALKLRADELGIGNKVQFLGRTDLNTLNSLYFNATLFCLPSINRLEAFGVVLLEAMRAGIPLVTTDIPGSGVSWVNQDLVTGKVVPVGDASALASAFDEMLASPDLLTRFRGNAYARFRSEFTKEQMTGRFMELYKRISV